VEFELDQPEVAAEQLHGMEGVVDVQRNGARVEITVRDGSARLVGLIEALRPFGIHAVRMGEASLEDAFLHFTGHRIGPGGDLT
jgi:hypothetical protein